MSALPLERVQRSPPRWLVFFSVKGSRFVCGWFILLV